MIKVKKDLTGKFFNGIEVIEQAEDHISLNGRHRVRWKCRCVCGNIFYKVETSIKKGTSCGCIAKEKRKEPRPYRKKLNKYDLTGDYGIGWTSNTNKEFYFDLEDYDKIKEYTWREDERYVKTMINKKKLKLHQFLGFDYYDHENRNCFDNRKNNLRKCDQADNAHNHSKAKNNTSGFIGVTFRKDIQKWESYIYLSKKRKNLGDYANKEEAIKARLEGELKYFGPQFSPQRDLFKKYKIIVPSSF